MERDCVAPMRKAKIPIPAASCRVFRNFPEILWISVLHFRNNKDLNLSFDFIPRCKQRGIQI